MNSERRRVVARINNTSMYEQVYVPPRRTGKHIGLPRQILANQERTFAGKIFACSAVSLYC
jgi:hypothetical protein